MKTVIEMARIAGVRDDGQRFEFSEYKYLERFAELVRAEEREACAEVADYMAGRCLHPDEIADAIRARSET